MKIDLTKLALEEVQELVVGTRDGRAVTLFSNQINGKYQLVGTVRDCGALILSQWTEKGVSRDLTTDSNLRLTSKTIDFTQLPVDTLVMAEGKPLYFYAATDRKIDCYVGGKDSKSDPMPKYLDRYDVKHVALVEGRKVVWEGGECPLPEGVEVRVGIRTSEVIVDNCENLKGWKRHPGYAKRKEFTTPSSSDIIWYQITGRIV